LSVIFLYRNACGHQCCRGAFRIFPLPARAHRTFWVLYLSLGPRLRIRGQGPDVLELYGRLSRDLDGIQPSVDRHSHFYVLVLSSALLVPVSTLVLASSWVDVYVIDLYVSAKSHWVKSYENPPLRHENELQRFVKASQVTTTATEQILQPRWRFKNKKDAEWWGKKRSIFIYVCG